MFDSSDVYIYVLIPLIQSLWWQNGETEGVERVW